MLSSQTDVEPTVVLPRLPLDTGKVRFSTWYYEWVPGTLTDGTPADRDCHKKRLPRVGEPFVFFRITGGPMSMKEHAAGIYRYSDLTAPQVASSVGIVASCEKAVKHSPGRSWARLKFSSEKAQTRKPEQS